MMTPNATRGLRSFMCHAAEDKPVVRFVYHMLKAIGVEAWLDEDAIIGGEEWSKSVVSSLRESDLVIVFLSRKSGQKRGFVQREIKEAIDAHDLQPENSLFLIPIRLEPCDIPDSLRKWQCIDLFNKNGWNALRTALSARIAQLSDVKQLSTLPMDLTGALDPKALPALGLEDRFVAMAALLQTSYRGDYLAVLAELRQYRMKYPEDVSCLYYLATDLLEHRSAYEAVIELVEEWLPTLSADLAWQGRLLKVSGLSKLRKWFKEGRSRTDLFEAAKHDLQRAVELNAAISEAHANLAVVFAIEGRLMELDSALERAIETSGNPEMTTAFASMRVQLRRDPAALVSRMRDGFL